MLVLLSIWYQVVFKFELQKPLSVRFIVGYFQSIDFHLAANDYASAKAKAKAQTKWYC